MTDHGLLDDDETAQALGEMLMRVIGQLTFAGDGAVATTGFAIDGTSYEISVGVKRP